MFEREHFSSAAHAALNFVDDEQNTVLVANPAQLFQKSRRRWNVSAFALDRLYNDRGNFFRWRGSFEQTILDPIHCALHDSTVTTIFGAERIAILVRKRHVHNVEDLALEPEALRRF